MTRSSVLVNYMTCPLVILALAAPCFGFLQEIMNHRPTSIIEVASHRKDSDAKSEMKASMIQIHHAVIVGIINYSGH